MLRTSIEIWWLPFMQVGASTYLPCESDGGEPWWRLFTSVGVGGVAPVVTKGDEWWPSSSDGWINLARAEVAIPRCPETSWGDSLPSASTSPSAGTLTVNLGSGLLSLSWRVTQPGSKHA